MMRSSPIPPSVDTHGICLRHTGAPGSGESLKHSFTPIHRIPADRTVTAEQATLTAEGRDGDVEDLRGAAFEFVGIPALRRQPGKLAVHPIKLGKTRQI